jgi:hypothetical protein
MLRTECDDLRVRARDSEDMLLRDSDIKVQVSQQCHKFKMSYMYLYTMLYNHTNIDPLPQ